MPEKLRVYEDRLRTLRGGGHRCVVLNVTRRLTLYEEVQVDMAQLVSASLYWLSPELKRTLSDKGCCHERSVYYYSFVPLLKDRPEKCAYNRRTVHECKQVPPLRVSS